MSLKKTKVFVSKPPVYLSNFIQDFFWVYIPKGTAYKKFIPTLHSHLFFVLNGNLETIYGKNKFELDASVIGGVFTKVIEYRAEKEDVIYVGTSYKPDTLNKLFNADIKNCSNTFKSASKIVSNYNLQHYFLELIENKTDEIKAFEILLKMNKELFEKGKPKKTVFDSFIYEIYKNEGCVNIKYLATKYKVSQRYIEKLFASKIGISPSRFAKKFRFFSVVKTLIQDSPDLEDVIARYEYFDRSHFRKDFYKILGQTPKEFLANEFPLIEEVFKKLTPPNR